jgi:Tfp pilus assembly protein PilO
MSRRVTALVLFVILAVTAAWWFFLISPRNARIAELRDDRDAAVAEADRLRAAIAQLQAVQENDVAYLAAIGKLEAGIPKRAELAVFIEEVTALAEEVGVNLEATSPAEPAPVQGLDAYEIGVSLAMTGEYFELLGFLFGLDDMERIVVVDSVAITATSAGAGEVEETTTTTTVAGGDTTSTTSTSTTTTTVPWIEEDSLSIALSIKLYTRSPLLPILTAEEVEGEGGAQQEGDNLEGDAAEPGQGIEFEPVEGPPPTIGEASGGLP